MSTSRIGITDLPTWRFFTKLWFAILAAVGVIPWIGMYEKRAMFKLADVWIIVVVFLWDLFFFKLVRSHVKLALLLFDGLNCLIGLGILVCEKFGEDGWFISSFYFGVAFVTWMLTSKSLRKDTIRDSIEEIKRM